jgi:hypothetical protein
VRVIVTGGRDYSDRAKLFEVLGIVYHDHDRDFTVIQGGADGADKLARIFAKEHGVKCITYEADWATHGRSAGPKRNQHMIDSSHADIVIAFKGNRGTADCIARAKAACILIFIVE